MSTGPYEISADRDWENAVSHPTSVEVEKEGISRTEYTLKEGEEELEQKCVVRNFWLNA